MPGGSAAAPVWQALVGRPVVRAGRFRAGPHQRARVDRLLLWIGRAADACPAAVPAFARRQRRSRTHQRGSKDARGLRTGRARAGTSKSARSGVRHSIPRCSCPIWRSTPTARLDVPGSAAFWALAFGDGDANRDRAGVVDGPRVEFASLCEQVFTGGQAVVRGPYQQVLFASRRIERITRTTSGTRVLATRAVVQYPALSGALERARITSIPIFAAAGRRAAALAGIDDDRRAAVTLAQYQGGIALAARARARGSIDDRQAAELIAALSAIEPDVRGDYGGKLVEWLIGAIAAGGPARTGPSHERRRRRRRESQLEADVLALISGPHAPPHQRRGVGRHALPDRLRPAAKPRGCAGCSVSRRPFPLRRRIADGGCRTSSKAPGSRAPRLTRSGRAIEAALDGGLLRERGSVAGRGSRSRAAGTFSAALTRAAKSGT